MKVETPQLRWHQIANPQSKKDAGANGPVLSCSLLSIDGATGVLATAGNTEVNLWRVGFTEDAARASTNAAASGTSVGSRSAVDDEDGNAKTDDGRRSSHILVQPWTKGADADGGGGSSDAPELSEHTRIEHVVTLSRGTNERSINAVKFSPSGLHLVAAGDGGTVVVWSVPPAHAGSTRSASFWSAVDKETDAPMRILFNRSDDVMDVAWSADSRRFAVCSLDHTVAVWEHAGCSPSGGVGGEWRNVHRSAKDHTHYVQGVACDPRGVYLASMGSDRMVKVYARKNAKEGVIKGEMAKYFVESSTAHSDAAGGEEKEQEQQDRKTILQSKVLPELLANSTFALQAKTKTMKFLTAKPTVTNGQHSENANGDEMDPLRPSSPTSNASTPKRHHMFADELTLGSFFRRLSFTTDGAFLVVPAALWHGKETSTLAAKGALPSPTSVASSEDRVAESSFATYLFARHRFDQPYKVLMGLEKPSVVVRPNPVLFQLPPNSNANPALLPYRSIFVVLTADTVLIYDTHHDRPLAMARGLHYAGLTDAAWSADGRTLFVTSSDGYVSILSFGVGELGEVYVPPTVKIVEKSGTSDATEVDEAKIGVTPSKDSGRPELNGVAINTLVPMKKKKIALTPVTASGQAGSGEAKKVTPPDNRTNQPETIRPVINTLVPKKKKKKIAPTVAAPAHQAKEACGKGNNTSTLQKKRPVVEEAVPSSEVQEMLVHVLIPKKKKKAASSPTPMATM